MAYLLVAILCFGFVIFGVWIAWENTDTSAPPSRPKKDKICPKCNKSYMNTDAYSCPLCGKLLIDAQNAPKCPTCGSYNVEPIGTVETASSMLVHGLASKKIGKSYKCNNCKYKW